MNVVQGAETSVNSPFNTRSQLLNTTGQPLPRQDTFLDFGDMTVADAHRDAARLTATCETFVQRQRMCRGSATLCAGDCWLHSL